MVTVRVEPEGGAWVCEVAVDHGGETSRHTVTVTRGDLARWGHGDDASAVDDLVSRSFRFLLEREPPSAILRRFDLAVIQRYFPDYDQQLKR
jgi:hypothetical protein